MSEAVSEAEINATYTKAIAAKLTNRAWRLQNLYWIEDENGQKVKFRMNWAQRAFFAAMWWLNVVLKARQLGLSTMSLILMLDRSLFSKNQTCGIIDKTDPDAKRKLDRIEFAYDHLDDPDDPLTAKLGAAVKQAVSLTKANERELAFSNGSKIWAGTSLRGSAVQLLLISELGYISFYNPKKAQEIKTGSLNTVHQGNIVIIESTHEGGKYGVNYDMIKLSQGSAAEPPALTVMDWRFHFYAWHQNPDYVLEVVGPLDLPADLVTYFAELAKGSETRPGIKLTPEQKHWYWKKKLYQGDAMWKEFPSTPEEAVNAVIKGAIYGKIMSALRSQRRIVDFKHDPSLPIYAFWDIGYSDFTSIWLLQIVGRDICALRYYCNRGQDAAHYMKQCVKWEAEYDAPISWHFLPHDADKVEGMGSAKTTKTFLITAGMDRRRITVVPRTPDIWVGIKGLRSLLHRFYFHATACGQEWKDGDQRMPSGIACLEGYHTKEEEGQAGMVYDKPVHDLASHGADSLRTFAEAEAQGLLKGVTPLERESRRRDIKVLRGPGPDSYAPDGSQSAGRPTRRVIR